MLIWNEPQLHRVIREYVGYFNQARPHQGIGQKVAGVPSLPLTPEGGGRIITYSVLNGLHHDYR